MLEISEMGTVNERIMRLINHFASGNKTAFGRAADLQSGLLAGIVGTRQSKPSFEVLQRILTAYSTVSPDWVLFGHEPMLREGAPVLMSFKGKSAYVTSEQYEELSDRIKTQKEVFEAYKQDLNEKTQLEQVYRITFAFSGHKSLADRLSLTDDEAKDLVFRGRVRSTYIGKDNEHARQNEMNYLITEVAVREFLGEA